MLEKERWKFWISYRGAPVRVFKKNTKDPDLALAEETAESKEENSEEVEDNKYVHLKSNGNILLMQQLNRKNSTL